MTRSSHIFRSVSSFDADAADADVATGVDAGAADADVATLDAGAAEADAAAGFDAGAAEADAAASLFFSGHALLVGGTCAGRTFVCSTRSRRSSVELRCARFGNGT